MCQPPGFAGSGSGFGEHGIVEVAGIGAVDRDQRQIAQVDPLAERDRRRRGRLGLGLGRKRDRQAEGLRREQGDRARLVRRAQALDHLCPAGPERRAGKALGDHQIAGAGAGAVLLAHQQLAARRRCRSAPGAGRPDPAAAARRSGPARAASTRMTSAEVSSSRQSTAGPGPDRRRPGAGARPPPVTQPDARRRILGLGRQAGERLAVLVERRDVEHRDARRRAGPPPPAAAARPRPRDPGASASGAGGRDP